MVEFIGSGVTLPGLGSLEKILIKSRLCKIMRNLGVFRENVLSHVERSGSPRTRKGNRAKIVVKIDFLGGKCPGGASQLTKMIRKRPITSFFIKAKVDREGRL
jgi:hypothetical protein